MTAASRGDLDDRLPHAFGLALREVAPPLAAVGAVVVGGYVLQGVTGRVFMHPLSYAFTSTFGPLVFACLLYAAAWSLVRTWTRLPRERRSWRAAWALARRRRLSTGRVASLLLNAVVVALLFDTIGQWKQAIPLISGFTWDARLASLDRMLHGTDPWIPLQTLVPGPAFTRVIDSLYAAWMPVVAAVVVWQCWHADAAARRRFLLAFVLTWIVLGAGAAHLLGSAGPCYYANVVGEPDPFRPLMQYLRQVDAAAPLVNVRAQDWLWSLHATGTTTPYTGISAMPSLHVAMPVLFTLAAWPLHRGIAVALAMYTLVILFGSVHLGWHYAIDGELSLAVVPLFWWVAGRLDALCRPVLNAGSRPPPDSWTSASRSPPRA